MTRDGGGANGIRRLALNAERLTELSFEEMREVVGGVTTAPTCPVLDDPRDPSDVATLCAWLTRTCT